MDNVKKFKEIANGLGELYEKKDKCYGGSFSSTYQKLGIISAVTRISDKYNRLCNLATNPDIDNLGENLEDTLKDLASYAIMTLIELRDTSSDKIHIGDKFYCTETVVMDDDVVAYRCGEYYTSEREGCITDEAGDIDHEWHNTSSFGYSWKDYFIKYERN